MVEYLEQAKEIAPIIGIDWNEVEFTPEDLAEGIKVEYEHGKHDARTNVTNDDLEMTAKIALAHLYERSDYYKGLEFVEEAPSGIFNYLYPPQIIFILLIIAIVLIIYHVAITIYEFVYV